MAGFALYHYDQTLASLVQGNSNDNRFTHYSRNSFKPTLERGILSRYPIHIWICLLDVSMATGRYSWSLADAVIFLRMATDWKDSYMMRGFDSKF